MRCRGDRNQMKRITIMVMIVILNVLVQNHLVSAKVATETQDKLIYISHIMNHTGIGTGNWRGLKIILESAICPTSPCNEIPIIKSQVSLDCTSRYRYEPEATLIFAGVNMRRFPTSIACFACDTSEDAKNSDNTNTLRKLFEVRSGEVEYLDNDPCVNIVLITDSFVPPDKQKALEFMLIFNSLP